jgi:hypothetical protein
MMSVAYTAVLDVSEGSVLFLSGLLHPERVRRGTRQGRRALGDRWSGKHAARADPDPQDRYSSSACSPPVLVATRPASTEIVETSGAFRSLPWCGGALPIAADPVNAVVDATDEQHGYERVEHASTNPRRQPEASGTAGRSALAPECSSSACESGLPPLFPPAVND